MYTYMFYNSSDDLKLEEDFVQSVTRSNTSDQVTVGQRFEEYCQDESVFAHNVDSTDLDPILEICITDSDIDSEEDSRLLVMTNKPKFPSPDREFMDQLVKQPNRGTDIHLPPLPNY